LIVSQLLAVTSLFFWLLMAGLSVMAFDSGVTQEAWNVVIAVWLYPIFPLVMIIGAWIAYARRKNWLAAILSGLSFIPPALLFLAMWIQTTFWSITQ
jgi:ABC-type Na+ efflux pump permease subunit